MTLVISVIEIRSDFWNINFMDQTHLHLIITHLPIFGSILGAIVLIIGIWKKSSETKMAAYVLFVISAAGGGIGFLTGEAAEETVENISGISEKLIEQHEESADIALISLIVLGIISVMGIIFTAVKSRFTSAIAVFALVVSMVSFGLVARTGYLGGQIRHTEINSNSASPLEIKNGEDHD